MTKYYFYKANITNTPIEKIKLELNFSTQAIQAKNKRYQRMIEFLIFLKLENIPNIVFLIVFAACFTKNLNHTHTETVKTIFATLKA